MRFFATIVMAPNHEEFEIHARGNVTAYGAAVIRPLTQCRKYTASSGLIMFHFDPNHPQFRCFNAITGSGTLHLDRNLFSELDDELKAAVVGSLSLEQSAHAIATVMSTTLPLLPMSKPPDCRAAFLRQALRDEPGHSLDELAAALQLSYSRTSHLFTEAIGLPFRSYQLWRKVHRVNRLLWAGKSLTQAAHDAGFADSAHLCRTFQQVFGRPPSFFFDTRYTKIHAPPLTLDRT
jgi:AraC family transcriptional regulator of arabinose operon